MANPMGYVVQPVVKDILVTNDGTTATFTVPNLGTDCFDGSGNLALWKLSRIFESARVNAVLHSDFVFRKTVTGSNKSAFIILVNMDMEKILYKRARKNRLIMPLKLSTSLSGFGKSSMDYVSLVEDVDDNTLLARLRFKYAAVDMNTRKSYQIPDELKNNYVVYSKPDLRPEGYKPDVRKMGSHKLITKVSASDIDRNGHLNNSIYIRLCIDCAAEACLDGLLQGFDGHLYDYNAKSMKALYQRECRMGETLTVHCWEDSSKLLTLHFEILKEDGKTSFCSMIDYYSKFESKI